MTGDRYEYEINVLLYATRHKIPIEEVPIETVYIEDNASSHFKPLRDAWLIYKMILLFVGSSFTSMLVDYVLVIVLTAVMTPHLAKAKTLLISTIVARVISALVNYSINRKLVFQNRDRLSLLRYFFVVAGIWAVNYGLLYFVSLVMPVAVGKVIVELLLYPISFLLQRNFVFPMSKEEIR